VDIGDHVEQEQLLAELDTPEIDQELSQAEEQVTQADAASKQVKANLDLDRLNLNRAERLLSDGVTTTQDVDQRRGQTVADEANLNAAVANRGAAAANVRRLSDLKAFARLVAPFAGTITSRTVERGTLVTAGATTPLFKIASLNPMRLFVAVPQDIAPTVESGVHADVIVREFPGRKFAAEVTRSTRELDAQTRTMSTELLAPNADGKLIAGMYATVAFALPSSHRVLELPATALYNDSRGRRVAIIDADDEVHFAPVVVERDTGPTVEISVGLDGTERVVKFANASLSDGTKVEIAQ
jgi:membrane fusion protein (multidrug efflux system)